jgi:hypothetical protein
MFFYGEWARDLAQGYRRFDQMWLSEYEPIARMFRKLLQRQPLKISNKR